MASSFLDQLMLYFRKEAEYTSMVIANRIRRTVSGVIIALFSMIFGLLGLQFLALSLFFLIAHLNAYTIAALITGLLSTFLSLILLTTGFRSIIHKQ